jgi:ABC-2 type transport system ATP-binding protein
MYAISTHNLTKTFGTTIAVDHVTLNIGEKEIYALVGPNGAGKTTLIKMLVGLLHPTSGYAYLRGHDISKEPIAAKREFGYVSDDPSVYGFLSGFEFLTFTGRLRGIEASRIWKRIDELEELFPIKDILGHPMNEYSRGNKQKVAFLASLISEPNILIIDEPIVGLDPASIGILGKTLVSYAKAGNTVFFVTHILEFAKKYARRVGVMEKGRILKEVSVADLGSIETLLSV